MAASALSLARVPPAAAQSPFFIQLDDAAFDMELDLARQRLYVSVPASNAVTFLSFATADVQSHTVGLKPHGIDISLDGSLLFAALNGAGSVAYLDLDTLELRQVDVSIPLGDPRTYDVAEGKPNRVFVSADPNSSGLSYIALIKRDQGDAVSRVASDAIIRAMPVFARSPDAQFLYIGEDFSPNSLYKLDLSTDTAPIVLEDVHGSVSGTQRLQVSPGGGRIYLGSGQVLRTSDFTQIGAVAAGIPRLNAADTLVYVAEKVNSFPGVSPIRVEIYETGLFTKVGAVDLPCSFDVLRDFELLDDGQGFIVLGDDNVCGSFPSRPHDLTVTLTESPDPAVFGSPVTFTATVKNVGTAGLTGVAATVALPKGLTFVSSAPGAPTCTHTGGVVTCALGALSPGATTSFSVEATPVFVGSIVTAASVSAVEGDDNAFNNTVKEATLVQLGTCSDGVADGSFESGIPNPFWTEFSLNFGTPLCTFAVCGDGGGTAGPRSGGVWAWFGGTNVLEQGSLAQNVTLPVGNATLQFHLWNGFSSGNQADFLRVMMDGVPVFSVLEGDARFASYQPVNVDLSAFADGGTHILSFESTTFGPGVTNFSVDDVSIQACPPPTLSIGAAGVTEGDEGMHAAVFDLTLSAPSLRTVSVPFSTQALTATEGEDYLAASGTLTIPPGVTNATISVAVLGDQVFEGIESFALGLGAPVGAVLVAPPVGIGTILDDDAAGLTIGGATVTEPESGSAMATFTVQLSPPVQSTVTVNYTTTDGSATVADGDYSATSGMLTFDPGATTRTIEVPVLADAGAEGPESFSVDLSMAAGAPIGHAQATGTIYDGGFYTVTPCRLIDTRLAASHLAGPALTAGQDRVFRLAGTCGIPAGAKAISVNLAVTGATTAGNVRLHPAGSPVPLISSINYAKGQTRSNNGIVSLDASGSLAVFVGQASGSVHFILDVNGFFY